jgi:hypothetical protein
MFIVTNRVARWFVFKPKIPSWLNFGGSCYGKSWYIFMTIWSILRPLETFFGLLVYIVVYIFGIFSPVLVFSTKKNLATLVTNIGWARLWVIFYKLIYLATLNVCAF